ncbi:hypothetical protein MOMA_02160 [Moraxella macacae 0408225]|uniref:Uncharacterized protein n=1 Tax=Moraxella macacae 0408225 TaxID=1230338 RepID=L2F9N2_9GAMM|nr:hypothetical protein MOMA_02160 [Moraxella macacae 0408225]
MLLADVDCLKNHISYKTLNTNQDKNPSKKLIINSEIVYTNQDLEYVTNLLCSFFKINITKNET